MAIVLNYDPTPDSSPSTAPVIDISEPSAVAEGSRKILLAAAEIIDRGGGEAS